MMRMPLPNQVKVHGKTVADAPARPTWLDDLLSGVDSRLITGSVPGLGLCIFELAGQRFVNARITDAADLSDAEFERATTAAYGDIAAQFRIAPSRHAVRIWNYIPDIHHACEEGLDRYMVFNAGRFKACQKWLARNLEGGSAVEYLPTASGVGHQGRDLVIDALGTEVKGVAVENPRQKPAYEYSRQYGPWPPCFARATMIPGANGQPDKLLVGGTASVLGETSVHERDLISQIDETLENLASLVRAASGRGRNGDNSGLLDGFREVRVYYPRRADAATIGRIVRERFSARARIECVPATLCRKELLVEIEGVVVGGETACQQ